MPEDVRELVTTAGHQGLKCLEMVERMEEEPRGASWYGWLLGFLLG